MASAAEKSVANTTQTRVTMNKKESRQKAEALVTFLKAEIGPITQQERQKASFCF